MVCNGSKLLRFVEVVFVLLWPHVTMQIWRMCKLYQGHKYILITFRMIYSYFEVYLKFFLLFSMD